jgi:hypothetical protein
VVAALARLLPGRRALVAVDVTLALWTVAWVAMGVAVSRQVGGLTSTTYTISNVGGAIDQAGAALQSLGSLPVVGERLSGPADQIRSTGRSAVASGRDSRASIHRLSGLLGFAVALIPSVPLVAIYLPVRIGRARERRALQRAVRAAGDDDPELRRFLAGRALQTLPYRELRRLGVGVHRSDDGSSEERLARAELDRLGVSGGRG